MAVDKFTAAQMIEAAQKTFGLVSQMAQYLHCDDATVRRYIKNYPTVAQAVADQREALVDRAEISLRDRVNSGEPWAVSLVLKTLGKNRGYVERQEVTGADSGPIEIKDVSHVISKLLPEPPEE